MKNLENFYNAHSKLFIQYKRSATEGSPKSANAAKKGSNMWESCS